MTMEDMLYTGTIPALPNGTTVQYKIFARDYAENWVESGVLSYTVGAPPPLVLPPVALFTENATIVLTGEAIAFNASASYDPDGFIVSYFWDFGDGNNATGVITAHSYADDGNYTVTLTVTDDDGASNSTSATKTVLNRPPVAIFTESAETVDVGETISFNASSSSDPDGFIVSYFWDFGDGTNASGVTTNHSYSAAGNYTVTLTVTDDDGASLLNRQRSPTLARPYSSTQATVTIQTEQSLIICGILGMALLRMTLRHPTPDNG